MAAFSFCNNECEINENKVSISKIFLWYKQDFIEQIDDERSTDDKRLLM
jgi:hypothetical protein